jgi:pre-mRNA-processing factor 17
MAPLTAQDPNGSGMAIITRPTDKVMNVNLTYEDMQRPVQGPEDPFNQKKNKGMNTLSGMFPCPGSLVGPC